MIRILSIGSGLCGDVDKASGSITKWNFLNSGNLCTRACYYLWSMSLTQRDVVVLTMNINCKK